MSIIWIFIITWLVIGFLSSLLWIYIIAKDSGEVQLRAVVYGIPVGTVLGLVTFYFACEDYDLFDTVIWKAKK
jgi:hypothetical protein